MFRSKTKSNYLDPSKNSNAEMMELDKWIISDFVQNRILPIVGIHPYPIDELMLMVSTVCHVKPTHIIEWGTHIGKSARIFYETITCFNISSKILSFDLPDEDEHIEHPKERRGMLVKGLPTVELFQEDALVKGIQIYLDSNIDEKKALFFVDGDHSYETVSKELKAIYDVVPDANVLLHDTFYQSEESNYNIGPYLAIKEFLIKSPQSFKRVDTFFGLPGMTFLSPV